MTFPENGYAPKMSGISWQVRAMEGIYGIYIMEHLSVSLGDVLEDLSK